MKAMYEMAIITKRNAALLSRIYGFDSPNALAESLPQNARIADIGSGNSKFGQSITSIRDDVQWMSVDRRYGMRGLHRRRQRHAPDNFHYVAADAANLPFGWGQFDRVYCSALMPYLVMTDSDLAKGAVHEMASLLSSNGELHVSDFVCKAKEAMPDGAIHITYDMYQNSPESVANMVVEEMYLGSIGNERTQALSNLCSHYMGWNALSRHIGV